MSTLPNPFLNSTVIPEPPAVEYPAVAPSPGKGDATAERFSEPTSSTGGPQGTPASAPSKNPDVGVLADRIDWHEFFEAVMDERIVLFELYDEVPLFLRDGEHLRRWTA